MRNFRTSEQLHKHLLNDSRNACCRYLGQEDVEDDNVDGVGNISGLVTSGAGNVARLPNPDSDGRPPQFRCRNFARRHPHPAVAYADFECYYDPVETVDEAAGAAPASATRLVGTNSRVASYGFVPVGRAGYVPPREMTRSNLVRHDGGDVDVAKAFVERIADLADHYLQAVREAPFPTASKSKRDLDDYGRSRTCYMCRKTFARKGGNAVDKCWDHNHFTGEYRGAACGRCNRQAKTPKTLMVYFHNLKGYDGHLLMKAIVALRTGAAPSSSAGEASSASAASSAPSAAPAAFDAEEEDDNAAGDSEDSDDEGSEDEEDDEDEEPQGPLLSRDYSKWRLSVLATTQETYTMIRFGPIIFKDTYKFLASSLDKLIENQRGSFPTLAEAFPLLRQHHPGLQALSGGSGSQPVEAEVEARLALLLRKLPMPFAAMTGPEVWERPAVLPRHCYDKHLPVPEPCGEEAYELVRETVRQLGLTSFAEYHDAYLHTDVLGLADIFEFLRDRFLAEHRVDCAHSVSLPSCAMQAMLLATGVRLDLISEVNGGERLMRDVNDNIRGGCSCIFQPYARSNQPEDGEEWYDPSRPNREIVYVDVTSLYPDVMTRKLPEGDFGKVVVPEDEGDAVQFAQALLRHYTDDSDVGYMLVVDFDVPEEFHDELDFAPVAKRATSEEELTELQRARRAFFGGAQGEVKLMPYLGAQLEVGVHAALLKYYVERMHVRITKVHRVWSWRQSTWLGDWILRLAKARAESTNEAERSFLKLTMNSLYGMFLQNKLKYRNLNLYTDPRKWARAVYKHGVRDWDIQLRGDDNGEGFLGVSQTAKKGGVVLDTPRLVGFSILELSKVKMYRIHYGFFKPTYGSRSRLCMMDTDSFIAEVETPSFLEDMRRANEDPALRDVVRFDFGVQDKRTKLMLRKCDHFGELGSVKYENQQRRIVKYVGAQTKMYALLFADQKQELRCRGIPQMALRSAHEHFRSFEELVLCDVPAQPDLIRFRRIGSMRHTLQHLEQVKKGLASNNDKVFQYGLLTSRPLGHWRNRQDLQLSSNKRGAPPSSDDEDL